MTRNAPDWRESGVRIACHDQLDPRTPQTPGMYREAAISRGEATVRAYDLGVNAHVALRSPVILPAAQTVVAALNPQPQLPDTRRRCRAARQGHLCPSGPRDATMNEPSRQQAAGGAAP
jgi:hypothetical protein